MTLESWTDIDKPTVCAATVRKPFFDEKNLAVRFTAEITINFDRFFLDLHRQKNLNTSVPIYKIILYKILSLHFKTLWKPVSSVKVILAINVAWAKITEALVLKNTFFDRNI